MHVRVLSKILFKYVRSIHTNYKYVSIVYNKDLCKCSSGVLNMKYGLTLLKKILEYEVILKNKSCLWNLSP